MSKAENDAKLAQVKLALAGKCDRLIETTRSKPRRAKLVRQAAKFRRQVSDLTRK